MSSVTIPNSTVGPCCNTVEEIYLEIFLIKILRIFGMVLK